MPRARGIVYDAAVTDASNAVVSNIDKKTCSQSWVLSVDEDVHCRQLPHDD